MDKLTGEWVMERWEGFKSCFLLMQVNGKVTEAVLLYAINRFVKKIRENNYRIDYSKIVTCKADISTIIPEDDVTIKKRSNA